jgi:hypothetical protein
MRRLVRTVWLIANWSFYVLLPLWIIPIGIVFFGYAFYRQFTLKLEEFTDDDWYIRDIFLKGDRFAVQDEDKGFRSQDQYIKLRFDRAMIKLLEAKRRQNRIKRYDKTLAYVRYSLILQG